MHRVPVRLSRLHPHQHEPYHFITRRNHIDIQRHVLYEDNHLLVVNKPSGLLVQPPDSHDDRRILTNTTNPAVGNNTTSLNLLDEVKHYLQTTHHKPRAWVGLVHRLDRPTSGVMVFAKTSKAASRLSFTFRTRTCGKVYLGVVEGRVVQSGRCENWLSKGGVGGQPVQVADHLPAPDTPYSPSAAPFSSASSSALSTSSTSGDFLDSRYVKGVLSYRPLVSFWCGVDDRPPVGNTTGPGPDTDTGTGTGPWSDSAGAAKVVHTICRIELETGRKHQIRAQMAHVGHPIVGDVKYGASQSFKQRDIALHAYMLTITHPIHGEDMTFTAQPPELWSKRFGAASLVTAMDKMTDNEDSNMK